jgi:Zn-dependent M28 family amino/carboxypeptidase
MRALPLLVIAVAAGCGGGSDMPPDAPPIADGPPIDPPDAPPVDPPDAAPCPSLDMCGWLVGYQQEIVGKLSGEREITPGVTINRRASNADRTTARTFLRDELTALGYTPELHQYAGNGANVFATLPATITPSGGAIVLGAHFDGIPTSPAAADNATGTATVMAMARYLPTVADRSHDLILVLFDQEEIGLLGSDAFAQKLLADGTVVDAVHSFDMISFDGDGDEAVELWSPSPSLETAYRAVGDAMGMPIQPVAFMYSDHQSFLDHGFTTVGVCEEYVAMDHTAHYHEPTDTYDKINWAYLSKVTQLALTVVITSATD